MPEVKTSIPESTENSDLDREELEALGRIAHAFRQHHIEAAWEVKRWEWNYSILSEPHKQLVSHIPAKIATARHCIHQNQLFFKQLLDAMTDAGGAPEPLCYSNEAADAWAAAHGQAISPGDAEKVRYVLKNLMRDWSEEGHGERDESYGAIIAALRDVFSPQLEAASRDGDDVNMLVSPPRVLVPGCGLARLCVELAGHGFETLGNEHSYFMLLASGFVLNQTSRARQWTIFPWAMNCSNHLKDADQVRPIQIPDVKPSSLIGENQGLLGMAAGDFVEVCSRDEFKANFDAVVTCFFLDTAHNAIEYMEIIRRVLKPGGWWVHLGPLQWHWADAHTYLTNPEPSLEISLSDIQRIAMHLGFKFESYETGKRCRYMSDVRGMVRQAYDCAFWKAQRSLDSEVTGGGEGGVPGRVYADVAASRNCCAGGDQVPNGAL